ncbi:hypothetical protein Lalb_Chr15g0090701 [Lupinus albus]|uniref:Uncharacterized protein n=1 Tax=Lupinus albus TaxID=3870 RepID=A0A6A4PEZ2_LUPAL|nr:hypothetical protein Lalb_Chr15g0090701 [Lupinus albus]
MVSSLGFDALKVDVVCCCNVLCYVGVTENLVRPWGLISIVRITHHSLIRIIIPSCYIFLEKGKTLYFIATI